MLVKKILSLIAVAVIGGCIHVPESLRVDESTTLTNFSNVRASANQFQGNLARWGGVIAKVENNADNTMLEVVYFDLKASTRPMVKDETQGRFRLYYKGLLDPVIYKEGRSITAIGNVAPSEEGKIGEHEYVYPVMNATHVHLWKEIKKMDVRVTHRPLWYTPSLWHYPNVFYPPIYYPYGKNKPNQLNQSNQSSNK